MLWKPCTEVITGGGFQLGKWSSTPGKMHYIDDSLPPSPLNFLSTKNNRLFLWQGKGSQSIKLTTDHPLLQFMPWCCVKFYLPEPWLLVRPGFINPTDLNRFWRWYFPRSGSLKLLRFLIWSAQQKVYPLDETSTRNWRVDQGRKSVGWHKLLQVVLKQYGSNSTKVADE